MVKVSLISLSQGNCTEGTILNDEISASNAIKSIEEDCDNREMSDGSLMFGK